MPCTITTGLCSAAFASFGWINAIEPITNASAMRICKLLFLTKITFIPPYSSYTTLFYTRKICQKSEQGNVYEMILQKYK